MQNRNIESQNKEMVGKAKTFILNIILHIVYASHTHQDSSSEITLDVIERQISSLLQYTSDISSRADLYKTHNQSTESLLAPLIIHVFRDCIEIYEAGNHRSGVYSIHVMHGFYSIPIHCDMDTVGTFSSRRGWMTIQTRNSGKINFDRGWNDYLYGFGLPDQEHWIGLRNILKMTQQKKIGKYDDDNPILRIDVIDWDGKVGYMEHSSFSLLSEEFDFKIEDLGRYVGTKELDAPLEFSGSSPFSTRDHNNDRLRDEECVRSQRGGWWFGYCRKMNLNGVYSMKKETMSREKIFIQGWRRVNPKHTALRFISMKLQ